MSKQGELLIEEFVGPDGTITYYEDAESINIPENDLLEDIIKRLGGD